MKKQKRVFLLMLCMLYMLAFVPLQAFAATKASIKLSTNSCTITVDSTKKLEATVTGKSTKVTWKSSNTKVATVSSAGKITAKKAGKATITAKANGKTAKCVVTVKAVNYKSLYKKFLAKSSVAADTRNIKPGYFYLLNINKTGVPELVVVDKSHSGPYCVYYVYTIKNNKVVYMGSCTYKGMGSTPYLYYSTKYKSLYVCGWTNFVGGVWGSYYGISGSKLVGKQHCREWTNPVEYAIGDTADKESIVSKSKYNSFYKKYFKNGNIKKYKMQKNTEANRKKYIK